MRRALPVLSILLLAACAPRAVEGPWRTGDPVLSPWRVAAVEHQPEFVRVRLEGGGQTTGIELVGRGDDPCEWATLFLRVQPAPGQSPPDPLLRAVRDGLRAWEAGPAGRSLLAAAPVAEVPLDGRLTGLVAAWMAALAATLVVLARRVRAARGPLALALGGVAAATLAGALTAPADLPVAWLTVLHEGLGRWIVEQLYARGVHAGPMAGWLARLAAHGSSPGLRDVAWLNSALAVVNLAGTAACAWTVTGRVVAAPLAAALLLLCPPFVLSAGSELAAQPACTLALGAAAALGLSSRVAGRGARWLSATTLALTAALAGLLRVELLLPAGAALAGPLGRAVVGDRRAEALRERARAALAPWPARAALAAAVIVGGLALRGLQGGSLGKLDWALAGVNPLDASMAALPAALALALPAGGVVLVLVALARGLLVARAPLLVPLALAALIKTAEAASLGDVHVLLRLTAYVVPAALLASLPALPSLLDASARLARATRGPRKVALLLAALALLPGAWTGLPALSPWGTGVAEAGAPQVSLDRNTQAEARALITWTETHPDCVFVARVVAADRAVEEPLPWQWKLFGRPLASSRDRPWREGDDPARVVAQAAPRARCALLYCGLDTNLVPAGGPAPSGVEGPSPSVVEGCPEARGLPEVEVWRFPSRPYVDGAKFGTHRPGITLGAYALSPPPSRAAPAPTPAAPAR